MPRPDLDALFDALRDAPAAALARQAERDRLAPIPAAMRASVLETGLRGQVLWHGSDGLDGTVPGRPKGPDSGAEVSLGVVRCHLGGPEGGTRYCGWATPPPLLQGSRDRSGGSWTTRA